MSDALRGMRRGIQGISQQIFQRGRMSGPLAAYNTQIAIRCGFSDIYRLEGAPVLELSPRKFPLTPVVPARRNPCGCSPVRKLLYAIELQGKRGRANASAWRSSGAAHVPRIPRLTTGLNPGRQTCR
jgi:hypothetical protein